MTHPTSLPSEYRDLPGDNLPDSCPLCDSALTWDHEPGDPDTGYGAYSNATCPVCWVLVAMDETTDDPLLTPDTRTIDYLADRMRALVDHLNPDALLDMASAISVAQAKKRQRDQWDAKHREMFKDCCCAKFGTEVKA